MRAAGRLAALALTIAAGLATGCGPMLLGGSNPSPPPAHFLVVVHNLDVAYADTASITWWKDSSVIGTRELLMPAGGKVAFDLGPDHPDGIQIIATAWAGIPNGPGGAVWETPDYAATWIFHVTYPRAGSWLGGPP